jgi:hypothetical protein
MLCQRFCQRIKKLPEKLTSQGGKGRGNLSGSDWTQSRMRAWADDSRCVGLESPGSESKRGEASVLRGAAARVEVSETVVSPLVSTRSRVPSVYDGD